MKKRFVLAAVLAAAGLGIGMAGFSAPTLAGGACPSTNVTGWWSATQSNGYQFNLLLQQDGPVAMGNYTGLAGTYFLDPTWVEKGAYEPSSANVGLSGTVNGNQIDFTTGQQYKVDDVYRATGVYATQGHYTGTVQDYQIINGQAEDLDNPGHFATWTAQGGPACAG
jgi:hypothetical protein